MSLHQDAVRALTEWTAPGPAQDALRQEYVEHLGEHPEGMWKACAQGHLTGSALVVDPERGQVLLTLHRKLGMWLQTGGHCEPGDSTLAGAALREAVEESGIADLRLLPGGPVRLDRHRTPCAWHLDVQYAALAPPGAVEAVSEESLDLRWYRFDEVAEVADRSVALLTERVRVLV
ncbi:NUDIX hydrolase [Streptomyces sp. 549]|uniref:NUDIX hydrolase n=1 Tax=Streptomyces sp. 549 TaxID=3049076 RepID=UPI0024C3D393|nr:NUDIX hydrolase [Streptomyces sp. 549]MDK1476712.1 NUDIX hydrolase [Streptomyces sp. 549]